MDNKKLREEIRKEVLAEVFPTIQFTIEALKKQKRIVEEKEKMINDLALNMFGIEAINRILESMDKGK